MTYSLMVSGSYDELEKKTDIENKARGLVESLSNVSSATLTTTHGGQVNLLEARKESE